VGEPVVEQEDVLADVSDDVLVQRAVDGDTDAFAGLIGRHGPQLRALMTRLTGSQAEGDQLAQETFYQAWRELPQLEEGAALRGWLLRSGTRLALTHLRSTRPSDDGRPAAAASGDLAEADVPDGRRARLAALSRVLGALPENDRHCWLLREMGGLDYDEIADQLQLPVTDVRGCLARARASIYTRMEEWR